MGRLLVNDNKWEYFAFVSVWLFTMFMMFYSMRDPDTYWHLANGREMVNAGQIILEEVFSYTHFGEEFANHSWLGQIILYLVWLFSGFYGLFAFKLLVASIVVWLLYRTLLMIGSHPGIAAVLCCAAILAGFQRFTVRTELFSLLNMALITYILFGFRANKLPRQALWLLPIIFVLWDWLHGSVYGLAFFILFTSGENAKLLIPRLRHEQSVSKENIKFLNLSFVVTMIAMLINPLGIRSYDIFFKVAQDETFNKITEFLPVTWQWDKPYILLFAWAALLSLRHIRKFDITGLFLLVAFGVLALKYSRATCVSSIVLIQIIASLNVIAAQNLKNKIESRLHAAIIVTATIFIVSYGSYIKLISKTADRPFDYQVVDRGYPVGSVRFIQALGLSGNIYNPGEFGGYLSFYLAPERKIFQYNLPSVFGDTYRYPDYPEELEKWNINYAITSDDRELTELFPVQDWARIYRDPFATVVIRRTPENMKLIEQFEIHYLFPARPDFSLRSTMRNQKTLPRFAYEIGVYLAFQKDARIAAIWLEILEKWPVLQKNPRIQHLLREALKYNSDTKLSRLKIA